MTSLTSNCARLRASNAVTNQSFVQLPVPLSSITVWHVQLNLIAISLVSQFANAAISLSPSRVGTLVTDPMRCIIKSEVKGRKQYFVECSRTRATEIRHESQRCDA